MIREGAGIDDVVFLAIGVEGWRGARVTASFCLQGWKGGEGYITKGMLKEHMPAPGDGVKILR